MQDETEVVDRDGDDVCDTSYSENSSSGDIANAALIAAARNALPALLAMARERDDLRRERDAFRDMKPGLSGWRRQIMRLRFGDQERAFKEVSRKLMGCRSTLAKVEAERTALAAQLAETSDRLRKAEEHNRNRRRLIQRRKKPPPP